MNKYLLEKSSIIYNGGDLDWGSPESVIRVYLNNRIPDGLSTSW
jgi:hypothetical protein